MSFKRTVFNLEWEDKNLNPQWAYWIEAVKNDPYKARCRLCSKTFNLSNMGRQAIQSHAKSAKHVKSEEFRKQPPITELFSSSADTSVECKPNVKKYEEAKSTSLINYVPKETTVKAEILWALKLVMSHSSYNCFHDVGEIFKVMFSDSDIAKSLSIGRSKIAYMITFGLAPYFHSLLLRDISKSFFVICIDEASNRVVQKGQMDLIIRYWPDNSSTVKVRYLKSVFLGHSTALDLYQKFHEATVDLNLEKLLQISMDGPYVNLKFWKLLYDELNENKCCSLLNTGTCSLHIIHGAFQTGNTASTWKLNTFFQSIYRLFKDSPARRADFIAVANSDVFPRKFCQIRWVENVVVAERALEVFPNIKKYFEEKKKELPKTLSIDRIEEACRDKLLLAKISFYISVANILHPFLKSFQSPSPMLPFLYRSLAELLRGLMTRFIRNDILVEASTPMKLTKIDVSSIKVQKRVDEIDIGIAARSFLKKSDASDSEKNKFFADCKNFLLNITTKIIQKSPINFSVVRSMSCLDPNLMHSNSVLCEKRMDNLLQLLLEHNILSALSADLAKQQFLQIINKVKTDWNEIFSKFSTKETKLDEFFSSHLDKNDDRFKELWQVIKIVLTLSHGNASPESGFSINKDMLVENLQESSLVALRTTYDAVKSFGSELSVEITSDMIKSVQSARNRYRHALDERKQLVEKEKIATLDRKRALDQIKVLQEKKAKLAVDLQMQNKEIEEQINELKKNVI